MKEKLKHYAKEIATFIVIITIFANFISFYKSGDLNKEPLNNLNLTLLDKTNYSNKDTKPILIHFWATWCPTCKVEASNIEMISQHFEVLTFAVSSGEDEKIESYMKENEFSYRVFNDKDGFFAQEFKVGVYPTSFIYDKDKKLVFSEVGYTSSWGLWLRMWWAGF